jgi:NADH:ubiquinone oxidoreductase subunit 5 (subunit L)/multisubunit Na+/H+ antiporter MnhA subunit
MGILFALAQPDMKRTLACSSAENMGIICLAIGAGLLAAMHQAAFALLLFFGGALLHLWNHSLFKSLSFLVASAVHMSTGTTVINQLGGLQKRMPFAGGCMAVASASIAGVPPFNGFSGEFLLYLGFIAGAFATQHAEGTLFFWAGLLTLAGIAGLSLLAFSRLYGLIFLGAPRSSVALHGQAAGVEQRAAMIFLAALCLLFALASPWLFLSLKPALLGLVVNLGLPLPAFAPDDGDLTHIADLLRFLSGGCLALILLVALILPLRWRLSQRYPSCSGPTWDCGYLFPSARMQYTGGAFALLPVSFYRAFLHPEMTLPALSGADALFPPSAKAAFTSPDWAQRLWQRLFQSISRTADSAKVLQQGVVNLYLLYILVALLAALIWALGWSP